MIQDKRKIQVKAPASVIFDLIYRMPNKFPIYKFLETKPFFFIRILLVDGLRSAWEGVWLQKPNDALKLNVGDTIGPFTLIESDRPMKYWFSLKSFFFDCQTGYSLFSKDGGTELCFDLVAENPSFREKIWWFLFKPFHVLFANKALNVIKEESEHNKANADDVKSHATD